MPIRIEHLALWTQDLERSRDFYIKYFGARSNEKYHNPTKQLETYFLSFEGGARLEIMKRPEVYDEGERVFQRGFTHLAFSLGSREAVDELTRQLVADGYPKLDGPRTTGDGYYESQVMDPDGNLLELTV
jgi:lactoylglutathione lyase